MNSRGFVFCGDAQCCTMFAPGSDQPGAPPSRRPNAAKGGILGKNDSQYW
jgi:hypothetical protein